MTFSTKYLAEAIALLGIAWAVIRWIGRSLLDISGRSGGSAGSPDAESHRLLAFVGRKPRETATAGVDDARVADQRSALDVTVRELRADGPIAERAASMGETERQAVYADLVRQLSGGGVSEAERAFALAVARERLGLKDRGR